MFVVKEVGVLPPGARVSGEEVGGMVLVWGINFPATFDDPATYHLIPQEYLLDLPYPGMPRGLSPKEEAYWLPPRPVFFPGDLGDLWPDLVQARIEQGVSAEELDEGGVVLFDLVVHGKSYLKMIGYVS